MSKCRQIISFKTPGRLAFSQGREKDDHELFGLVDRLIEAGIHEAFGFVLSTRRPTTLLRAVILLGVALQVQLLWDLLLLVLCLAPHCVEFGVRLSGFSVIVSSSALLEIYKPMTSEATIWRSKKMETNVKDESLVYGIDKLLEIGATCFFMIGLAGRKAMQLGVPNENSNIAGFVKMESDEDIPSGGVRLPDHLHQNQIIPRRYSSPPIRQPLGPPEDHILQRHAGFAKFLKTHISPRTKRVTAGGRIVPAGPQSPPPTFHMDFIDKVVQAGERAQQKLVDNGTSMEAMDQSVTHDMGEHLEPRSSSGNREQGRGSTTEYWRYEIKPMASQHMTEIAKAIHEQLSPKFEIQQPIDDRSALVRSGSTTYYAHMDSGKLSMETLKPEIVMVPSGVFHHEPQTSLLLPNYSSMDGAVNMPMLSTASTTMTGTEVQSYAKNFPFNGGFTAIGSQFEPIPSPLSGTSLAYTVQKTCSADLRLSELISEYNALLREHQTYEGKWSLEEDGYTPEERQIYLNLKRQRILKLDELRRLRLALEPSLREEVIPLPSSNSAHIDKHQSQPESKQGHSAHPLSPEAPSFVPGGVTKSSNQEEDKLNSPVLDSCSSGFRPTPVSVESSLVPRPRGLLGEWPSEVKRKEKEQAQAVGEIVPSLRSENSDGFSFLSQKAMARKEKNSAERQTANHPNVQIDSHENSDVRCNASAAAQPKPNATASPSSSGELQTVPVAKVVLDEAYEWICKERQIAYDLIEDIQSKTRWERDEANETQQMHVMRCLEQQALMQNLRSHADEKFEAAKSMLDAKVPTNSSVHPFAGNRKYNRHGYYALKSPSTLASPVFRASGTIPSIGNAAQTAFASMPNQTAEVPCKQTQPYLRGGGKIHRQNNAHSQQVTPPRKNAGFKAQGSHSFPQHGTPPRLNGAFQTRTDSSSLGTEQPSTSTRAGTGRTDLMHAQHDESFHGGTNTTDQYNRPYSHPRYPSHNETSHLSPKTDEHSQHELVQPCFYDIAEDRGHSNRSYLQSNVGASQNHGDFNRNVPRTTFVGVPMADPLSHTYAFSISKNEMPGTGPSRSTHTQRGSGKAPLMARSSRDRTQVDFGRPAVMNQSFSTYHTSHQHPSIYENTIRNAGTYGLGYQQRARRPPFNDRF